MLTIKQYEEILSEFSDKRKQILLKLYRFGPFPNANEIADALGYRNFGAANLQIGSIGKAISEQTGFIPGDYVDRGKYRPAYFALVHDFREDIGWELVDNLKRAIQNLWLKGDDKDQNYEKYGTELGTNGEKLFKEGKAIKLYVNRYERDKNLIQACIEIHGKICAGCHMSFEDKYGQGIVNIVEVHHKKPLSEIKAEEKKDPLKDLVPLCPNCHAVVHSVSPVMDIDELKARIENQRKQTN